jgi:hypothetical protein
MSTPYGKLEVRIQELNQRLTDAYQSELRARAGESGSSCTSSPSVPCCCSQPALLNLQQLLDDLASQVMQTRDSAPPAANPPG